MTDARTAAETWYAGGLRFECRRCLACCTGAPGVVMVTPEEIARLAERVGLPEDTFERRFLRRARGGRSLVERENGDCALLGPEGCTVYDLRPAQCRIFPFWDRNLRSPASWERAARECPGVNKGRLYPVEEIERLRDLDS